MENTICPGKYTGRHERLKVSDRTNKYTIIVFSFLNLLKKQSCP